ncbi:MULTISPECIES: histidine kinase dimerization/phosphoacceptor domain -containing protein [Rhodomicrobium]|uniref:sensor histidine kinase n=1 Tax=Rhodomicrobium TaxID=1068 RepID=UPI000B4B4197|nr:MULTISPECIES: histidine kinase dimerization/phosphoacceptor domain -containing protein [Rhodomicrobium]
MQRPAICVLFIDDDEALSRLVRKDLERHGFIAEIAHDGTAGLTRIAAGGIDAVVLDHHLPDQEGLHVLVEIGKLPDPPPVIYLTGAQDSRTAVAALKAGAADYVIKDVQGEFLPLLRADIEAGVQSAQLRRAKEAAEQEITAARDRYKALAAERALLLREVNHRVSNSLQLIASLLQFQSRAATPEVKDALLEAHNRVLAVAKVHRSLYTSQNVQSVSLHRYIEALAEDIQSAAGDSADANQFSLEAEAIEIEPDRAVAVGVILTELMLNARKHAYPQGNGPIRISLKMTEPNRGVLSVEDDGVGLNGGQLAGGLGTVIIKAMAQKLGAEMSYDPTHKGTRALVSFDPTSTPRRVV